PIQVEGGEWNAALVIRDTKPYQKALRDYEKKRDMETLALTDSLTGLYNRRYFDRRLGEELKRAERYGSPLALIMIDFDHFKEVNDLFGHLVGDEVLVTASRILSRGLRDVDALVRWGGEEFMIIMPETGVETSLKAAVRLHALIGEAQEWRSLAPGLAVTVSMGLVNIPWAEGPLSANQVLSMLDQALYKAKNNGRNQIIRYIAERDAFERV
ncbi:MAG: GGDEF domain-containing protein, partial [Candidatus Adiutrix sp.]|nr:GGDEF domain-containing protein [Candidatus Adiutrix sp.]